MVLAEAVLDAHGGVLLPCDTALTDAMLTSLRRRGIDRVRVIDDDVSEADLQAERERVRLRLAQLFRRCRNEPGSAALLQRVSDYRLGEAA